MTKPRFVDILKHPALMLATWFGCGLSKKAPGTIGTLGALPFIYIIHINGGNTAVLLFAIAIFFIGWLASYCYLRYYPDNPDPGAIVVDEVAGMALTMTVLFPTWKCYVLGFIVFRILDIMKPWPISVADEKIPGALGVMVDDMVAGLYAVAVYFLFGLFNLIYTHSFVKDIMLWLAT